jgi:predicted TIM-barrel fold metal-dependent hydrolase
MIDVHSHVFNLGYVPVQGILQSRGLGRPIARLVSKILLDALEWDESLPTAVMESFAARTGARAADESADDVIRAFSATVSVEFLQSHARDIGEAEAALDAQAPETRTTSAGTDAALEALAEGGLRGRLRRLLTRIARAISDGAALIQWFLLMLSRESELVGSLRRAWPESRLFVHHMMDMDNHYPNGRSLYPFVDLQLRRMRALVQASGGRLLTFVAFDPFREEGVEVVREALHDGCAGVKFYPPSGYRPLGNTVEDLKGTGQDPEEVDRRNLALFRLCAELDAPVFAHCSPGGMESRPKRHTGCLSDPRGWRRVLDTPGLRDLRLCLGHAGGDEGWCAPADAEEKNECGVPFVSEVIDLCVSFPNVYCEFGHTEQVFDSATRANFAARLGAAAGTHGARFGRKCMYGSDWHLLARVPAFHTFDDIFRTIFDADPRLRPHRPAFFMENALDYLNLPSYLDRNDRVLSDEEKRYLRSLLPGGR